MSSSSGWWSWLATWILLILFLVLHWQPALSAAVAVNVAQAMAFVARCKAVDAQVRIVFTALLVAGLVRPLVELHWLQFAGVTVVLFFDYCLLGRTLSLMPWNRTVPLSLTLIRRTYLSSQEPCGMIRTNQERQTK